MDGKNHGRVPEGLLERLAPGQVLALPCQTLVDYPLRPQFYDQVHLAYLTASIKETGLLEPILVRPDETGHQVLSGHYRLRAVRRLRWKVAHCRVQECDDRTALFIYCMANMFNRGLSAMEEAALLTVLAREGRFTLEEAAGFWGRSKSWASRRLKLLTALDPQIKEELANGRIGPRLAQELTRLPQGNDQERVLAVIKRQGLNKNEAAELVDWWRQATAEERVRSEEQPVPGSDNGTMALPSLMHALKRSIRALEELTELLQEQKIPLDQWPHSLRQIFLRAMYTVNAFIHLP